MISVTLVKKQVLMELYISFKYDFLLNFFSNFLYHQAPRVEHVHGMALATIDAMD